MNRKKRINDKLKKNLKDFHILIEDNSHLHKGHNNFDGKEETHILIKLFSKKKIQNITDKQILELEEKLAEKEKEIMTV